MSDVERTPSIQTQETSQIDGLADGEVTSSSHSDANQVNTDAKTESSTVLPPSPVSDKSLPEDANDVSQEKKVQVPQELQSEASHREQLKHRRLQKRKKVWVRRLQQLIKLGVFLALALLLTQIIRTFPLYSNGQVEWMGPSSQLVSSDAIERELAKEKQFFLLDVEKASHELMDRFPLLAHVEIRRRFLPTQSLMISVSEKPLWGLIYRTSTDLKNEKLPSLVVSEDNLIFPVKSLDRFVQYQQTHRQELMSLLIPSSRQEVMTAFKLTELQRLTQALRQYSDLPIRYLDWSQPEKLTLVCDGPDIYLGRLDETWEKRVKRLAALMPHWKAWTGKMRAVDLRWENQVTLHPILPLTP